MKSPQSHRAGWPTRLPEKAQSVNFALPRDGLLAARPVTLCGFLKTYGNVARPGVLDRGLKLPQRGAAKRL